MADQRSLIRPMGGPLAHCVCTSDFCDFGILTVPHRVVCPVSLVSQWASEIEKMCVGLRVVEHHGATRTTG
jgi:hypothetical protein